MANGFGTLFIGVSGLQSSQNALNTTANNLANVNTTGYVRQQVRFADKTYNKLKDPNKNVNMQQYGLGVSIGDVVHARDIFLDKSYRQENGRKGFYTSFYEITDYVQDLFQELNGEQFKQSVSDLHQAFQELEPNMDNSTQQNLVLEKADLLLSRTKSLYDDMKSYQSNINEQIKDDVDRVNEIGNRIYELNLQIQKVEAGGQETAMTLRDERDNLLDELGGFVPEIIVADVHLDLAVVDIDDMRADGVEEMTVVADDDDKAGVLVIQNKILEPVDGLDIKVVRRLVEHDDIGLAEQRLRKQHLDLQTRVGVGHEIIVPLHRDAEALQQL